MLHIDVIRFLEGTDITDATFLRCLYMHSKEFGDLTAGMTIVIKQDRLRR